MNFFFTNVAYADADSFIKNVNKLIINPIIILLFVLAFAYFAWGIMDFMGNQDNEEKKTSGKRHMIWGVIGITIMMGVWSLLNIILNSFNIPKNELDPKAGTVDLREYEPPYP